MRESKSLALPLGYTPVSSMGKAPGPEPKLRPFGLFQVGWVKGLEPPAHCLEGSCSIHLSYRRVSLSPRPAPAGSRSGMSKPFGTRTLERVMGIEPTRPAWKAGILPLNYTRMDDTFLSRQP